MTGDGRRAGGRGMVRDGETKTWRHRRCLEASGGAETVSFGLWMFVNFVVVFLTQPA